MCTREQCLAKMSASESYLKSEFGVKSLLLFGSMARGDNRIDSDVDVCVDMPPKAFKVVGLKLYLQELLGAAVDVVRLNPRLDSFLINEIRRDGITVF